MKTLIPTIGLVIGLVAMPLTAMESQQVNLELEPCINGSVSATGLYATQELEDAANIRLAVQRRALN